MKIRCTTTSISALLLSLCLVTFIPDGFRGASTWNMPFLKMPPSGSIVNYFIPLGFMSLGLVAIGLIVLWTGYKQNERRAWFVMLIILLCFIFPSDVFLLLMRIHVIGWRSLLEFMEEYWTVKGWWGCFMRLPLSDVGIEHMPLIIGAELLRFLVMLFALLLPVKAFFWRPPAAPVKVESPNEQA
jgi:hypothetical protein